MKKSKKIGIRKRLLYSIITFCILLVILEVLMIVLEPYLSTGLYEYDPDLGFRVRPGAAGTNRFGFMAREYPLEKAPGTYRMIVVGDSFNWAGGYPCNYIPLLEMLFDRQYGRHRVDVINTGYPCTHTVEQQAMMKKYALQYNPDLVVLGFFTGNDFIDALPWRKRIIVNDTYMDINKEDEITFLGYPIVFKSRLLGFIEQKIIEIKERLTVRTECGSEEYHPKKKAMKMGREPPCPPSPPVKRPEENGIRKLLLALDTLGDFVPEERAKQATAGRLSEKSFLDAEKIRLEFCRRGNQEAGKYDDNIAFIFDGLKEMNTLLKSRDIQFLVAIYPDSFQVDSEVLQRVMDTCHIDRETLERDFDLLMMQKILIPFLEENKIPHIDLTDIFRAVSRYVQLYGINDTHWNNYGNQLTAQRLFPRILKIVAAEIGPPPNLKNAKITH